MIAREVARGPDLYAAGEGARGVLFSGATRDRPDEGAGAHQARPRCAGEGACTYVSAPAPT